MKKYLKASLLNSISLYIVSTFISGLVVPQKLLGLFWTGVVFTLINRLIKPIIKLFLLPINLLTLGLFRWIANVLVLFILVKIMPGLKITQFTISAFNQSGFAIPSFHLSKLLSLVLISFLLSIVYNLINQILKS